MSRIAATFDKLKDQGRRALIPYVTAGFPYADVTPELMHGMVAAGADVIELGVPFSDPMADGPTIQRSSERALARGAGLSYVLETVRAFRRDDSTTPVVLMGYLNPVEIRGTERFAQDAISAGVDGVLLVDLPPEEAEETLAIFERAGLALILLASPTTPDARLDTLSAMARGYLYYVSFAGVTGASERLDSDAASARLRDLRTRSTGAVVGGFESKDGASGGARAKEADGVVVGSALVAALAEASGSDAAAAVAKAFLEPVRKARD